MVTDQTVALGYEEELIEFAISSQSGSKVGSVYGNHLATSATGLAYSLFGYIDPGNVRITEGFGQEVQRYIKTGTASSRRNLDGIVSKERSYNFEITDIKLPKGTGAARGGNHDWVRWAVMPFHSRATAGIVQENMIYRNADKSCMLSNSVTSTLATATYATTTEKSMWFHLHHRRRIDSTVYDKWLPWCKIDEMTIKGSVGGFWTADVRGMALGSLATWSGTLATGGTHGTAVATDPQLYSNGFVAIGSTEATGVTDVEFTIRNNIKVVRTFRTTEGRIRKAENPTNLVEGVRDVMVRLTKNFKNRSDYDDLVGGTRRTIRIGVGNDGYLAGEARFVARNCELTNDWDEPTGGVDEIIQQDLEFQAESASVQQLATQF